MGIEVPKWVEDDLIASGMATAADFDGTTPTPTPAAKSLRQTQTPAAPGFVEPPWWARFQFALHNPDGRVRGASIFGPRGTGKTSAAHEASRRAGIKLVTFQGATGCTIDDLMGVRDLVNGATVFTPGPLAEALEEDCWLCLEEANMVQDGVYSKMNTLLDGSGDKLRLPNGRSLEVGPRFRVILAYNPGSNYSSTRELNAALLDRLMPIYADYLPPASEVEVLQSHTGCDTDTAEKLVKFAVAVRAARQSLQFDLSPRALFRMLDLIQHCGCGWDEALKYGVLDLVGDPEDKAPQRAAVEKIAELCDLPTWDQPKFASDAKVAP